MLQNFKYDFFENGFLVDWCVRFKFHFQNLKNFSTRFFTMYRGILELKNNTRILRKKNDSFANRTICGLTALFVKIKIYFCRCNFVNKQINKNFLLSHRLYSIGRPQNITENICSFGNRTPNQWAPTNNVHV